MSRQIYKSTSNKSFFKVEFASEKLEKIGNPQYNIK